MLRACEPLFTLDDDWDESRASDGVSRFGAYLTQGLERDGFGFSSPGSWETFCWWTATPPVMSPGYVVMCPEIVGSSCAWDYDAGVGLVGTVTVCARLPERLPGWSGWIRRLGGELEGPPPGRRTALARVTFEAVLEGVVLLGDFDPPSLTRPELVAVAKGTVRDLAGAMNAAFGEAVAAVVP